MQTPLLHHPSHDYRCTPATAGSGRRQPTAGSFDYDLAYGTPTFNQPVSGPLFQPRTSAHHGSYVAPTAAHPSYHGHTHDYHQPLALSSPASQTPVYRHDSWSSPPPSPPALSDSPNGDSGYANVSPTSHSSTQSRNSYYDPRTEFPRYTPVPTDNYDSGLWPASTSPHSFLGDSGYSATAHSAPLGYSAHSVYPTRPQAAARRCEWAGCRMDIEDSTPSGIARHLKQYHDIQVTDNRSRSPCRWGARPCGKDMYPSSLGKHIAECHLRNMVKQCPHCGADFARADTLSRHIKGFCPNSNNS